MNTTIKSYDNMIYDSRPVKFSEFINDKYNNIHRELFVDALDAAIESYIEYCKEYHVDSRYSYSSISEFKRKVNIIEIKNTEYWMPSYVIWRTKSFPYRVISMIESGKTGKFSTKHTRGKMLLAPWWNMYQKFDEKSIDAIELGGEDVKDYKVIYLNYVQGIATLRSKMTDKEIQVPFEYLNDKTEVDEEMTLTNTFTTLLNTNRV